MKTFSSNGVARRSLVFLIILFFSILTNILTPFQASAVSFDYYEAESVAQLRVLYNAMEWCVSSYNNLNANVDYKQVQSGNIFNSTIGTDPLNTISGAWLEVMVAGGYKDGKIHCKENNSKLVSLFVAALSDAVSYAKSKDMNVDNDGDILRSNTSLMFDTLICGWGDANQGIMYKHNNMPCRNYGDDARWGADYGFHDKSAEFLGMLFELAIGYYSWQLPYKSWENPTSAEWYYIDLHAFQAACGVASGGGNYYTIIDQIDGNGGLTWTRYYKKLGDKTDGTNVYNYSSAMGTKLIQHNPTCRDLDGTLNNRGGNVRAAREQKFARLNLSCAYANYEIVENATMVAPPGSTKALKANNILNNDNWITNKPNDQTDNFSNVLDFNSNEPAQCIVDEELGMDTEITETDPLPPGSSPSDPCFTEAGALGWVACPVQDALSSAARGLYEKIADMLAVRSTLFDTQSGTFIAWQTFRNMANVVFIILLLIVIVSQVTGVGISNYGIKKVLPRLIVSAVLINLSYFICQLAVDATNLVGYSLANFLSTLVGSTGGGGLGVVIGTIMTASIAAIGIGVASGIATGGATVIPILLFLLSIVLAIIMLWVLLAVRQAIVVILVVISPLAFVCYALPNTEGLFKKWFGLFKVMLVMFPVCSIVVGGGILAHNILITGGNDFMTTFISVAAAVFPFFLIPMLIKSSMSGLGTLGTKLSGLSSSASKLAGRQGSKALQSNTHEAMQAFRRATPGLALTRGSRERRATAMREREQRQTRDFANRNLIAGTSAEAMGLYDAEVDNMSQGQANAALAQELSSGENMNIARAARLSQATSMGGLREALEGHNMNSEQFSAFSNLAMTGANRTRIFEGEPAIGRTLMASRNLGDAAPPAIAPRSYADYNNSQLAHMPTNDLRELYNNAVTRHGDETHAEASARAAAFSRRLAEIQNPPAGTPRIDMSDTEEANLAHLGDMLNHGAQTLADGANPALFNGDDALQRYENFQPAQAPVLAQPDVQVTIQRNADGTTSTASGIITGGATNQMIDEANRNNQNQ